MRRNLSNETGSVHRFAPMFSRSRCPSEHGCLEDGALLNDNVIVFFGSLHREGPRPRSIKYKTTPTTNMSTDEIGHCLSDIDRGGEDQCADHLNLRVA